MKVYTYQPLYEIEDATPVCASTLELLLAHKDCGIVEDVEAKRPFVVIKTTVDLSGLSWNEVSNASLAAIELAAENILSEQFTSTDDTIPSWIRDTDAYDAWSEGLDEPSYADENRLMTSQLFWGVHRHCLPPSTATGFEKCPPRKRSQTRQW
jgi:hypothetical protein